MDTTDEIQTAGSSTPTPTADRLEDLARQLAEQRERLEYAQRAGRIGTFDLDLRTDEFFWTPELEALYGLEPHQFGGTHDAWRAFVDPEDRARIETIRTEAMHAHREYESEYRITTADGFMRWLAMRGRFLYADDGTPERMVGVNIDITDRKHIEENLHFLSDASRELASSLDYEQTLQTVAQLAVPHIADWCTVDILDEHGQPQQVAVAHKDPARVEWARELRAATPPDMSVQQGLPEVLRTGKSEFYPLITDEMLVAGSRSNEELELARSLGFTSALIVAMHSGGKPIGAITFVTTESRKRYSEADLAMAEELAARASLAIDNARLYREAQAAIALRDDFMSIASHELKTPVTSLKVYAQLLQKQAQRRGDEASERSLRRMETQVDKLTKLIENLLNVSRIQIGRLEYEQLPLRLDELVMDLVEHARPSADGHEIVLEASESVEIVGDQDRIGQIVTNLLNNAIKYSPGADRVLVRVADLDDRAEVSVQDFGIGIDSDHQSEIFGRFYQVRDPQERTFPGLGLGLYISRDIAQRHGGTIEVSSVKGEGSTFRLVLPKAPVPVEAAVRHQEAG